MCPETELLSAYFDGEIPDPWQSRLKAHVAECPACRERLAGFSALRAVLRDDLPAADLEAGSARVLERLELGMPRGKKAPRPEAWWVKSVRIPLPLVAAALVAIALVPAVTIVAIGKTQGRSLASASSPNPGKIAVSAPNAQAVKPIAQATVVGSGSYATLDNVNIPADIQDIDSLLRFLDSQQLPVTISVELPAGRSYGYSGPPEIIKVPQGQKGQSGQ